MMPTTSAASTPSRRVTTRASNTGRLRSAAARRRLGLGAADADAVDAQRVPARHEAVGAADLGLQGGDPRAHELDHPAAAGADEVVVVLAGVDVLVEVAPAPEPLLARQAAGDQEVEVAVDGGARDGDARSVERREDGVGVDMPVLGEDLVEQGEALGGY